MHFTRSLWMELASRRLGTVMTNFFKFISRANLPDDRTKGPRWHLGLALLVASYIVICCLSFRVAYPHYLDFHILYDGVRLPYALAVVAAFATIAPLFVVTNFSFGYLVGFYFYSMILGYLWLNCFSKFQYDHVAAGISAAVSGVAFLLPALLVTSPIARPYEMSEKNFSRLVTFVLLFCAATACIAAAYNFRVVSISNIYEFRGQLQFPRILNYCIGAATSVLLPLAFACFVITRKHWLVIVVLLISISFYPSTLSRTAFFTPAWLVTLALISRFCGTRATTILSLLLLVLVGILLISVFGELARPYFNLVNFRMVIIPSSAMDVYNEYFANHPLTHFCQIWLLKPFVPCALEYPLSVEMQNNYALGNFNASLFATEGIASVGLWLAPITVFICGLVVALGNRLSAGLPSRFILLSAGVLPLLLQNVPFSTVMLTHGLWILFALWYLTPRAIFRTNGTSATSEPSG
jgi:hypothetical protein